MLGLKQSRAYFDFRWYLRHNPSVEMKYQPPGVLYCIAECGPQALSSTQVVEAAKRFVVACATEMTVLHGGITALPNRNQALAEASLVGVDVARSRNLCEALELRRGESDGLVAESASCLLDDASRASPREAGRPRGSL